MSHPTQSDDVTPRHVRIDDARRNAESDAAIHVHQRDIDNLISEQREMRREIRDGFEAMRASAEADRGRVAILEGELLSGAQIAENDRLRITRCENRHADHASARTVDAIARNGRSTGSRFSMSLLRHALTSLVSIAGSLGAVVAYLSSHGK